MDATSRLVVLTGASSGIGLAASRIFAAGGDRVIAVARDAGRLETLAAEPETGGRIVPIAADVTDAPAMEAMARRVLDEFGVPDVVVANAGIGLDAALATMTDEALQQVFDVNVFGLVRTIRPFIPGMTKRGSGRILLVSSIVGKRGTPYYSAYSGSKFALHGIADSLRTELWGSDVTVGLLCPSSTTTEFEKRRKVEGPGQKAYRPRRHAPETVARALVTMAGNRRREWIVGAEARLMWFVDLLFPSLIDRILARKLRTDL